MARHRFLIKKIFIVTICKSFFGKQHNVFLFGTYGIKTVESCYFMLEISGYIFFGPAFDQAALGM